MTRDEAISRVRHACLVMNTKAPEEFPESFVTALAELSGITFEKPKSLDDRLADVMRRSLSGGVGAKDMPIFKQELEAAGLSIVEK